jgi:hypothetical protein
MRYDRARGSLDRNATYIAAAMPASPLPGAFTPPPRSPTANDHEVLNGFRRRPASCPAMLQAVTAG